MGNKGSTSLETKIKLGLASLVLLILALVAMLLSAWQLTTLAVVTSLFLLSYPLTWLAYKTWQAWQQTWLVSILYAQSRRTSEPPVTPGKNRYSQYQQDLFKEVDLLVGAAAAKSFANSNLDKVLVQLFDGLPVSVWVFDTKHSLLYLNNNAKNNSSVPALIGSSADALGFEIVANRVGHPKLAVGWQVQSCQTELFTQAVTLVFASDISSQLQRNEHAVQANLVRVLSHELRNSLTPVSSLTDTLLSEPDWDEAQVRKVLQRINQRSDGLLGFVQRFSKVAKIPEANYSWFDFADIAEQTKVLFKPSQQPQIMGEQKCYGDQELLGQAVMNLVKNAVEACGDGKDSQVAIKFFIKGDYQHIQVLDNGTGFQNINNALTPLFTTKPSGTGIGLALVGAIINKHSGRLSLRNGEQGGAIAELTWPVIKLH